MFIDKRAFEKYRDVSLSFARSLSDEAISEWFMAYGSGVEGG